MPCVGIDLRAEIQARRLVLDAHVVSWFNNQEGESNVPCVAGQLVWLYPSVLLLPLKWHDIGTWAAIIRGTCNCRSRREEYSRFG